MAGSVSSPRGRRGLVAGALALLLVAVVALVWGLHRPAGDSPPSAGAAASASGVPAALSTPTASPSPRPTPTATPLLPRSTPLVTATGMATTHRPTPTRKPTSAAPKLLGHALPERLRIPSLGIDTSLLSLGIGSDHVVEVPPAPDQVGWYDGSPTPGQIGPAVIYGHVSWLGTPAAFFKVSTLKRGDTLTVSRSDGYVVTFTVQGTRSYPKDDFPTSKVYGNLPYAGLRLITCSGDYDSHRHYFPDNLVVYLQATAVHRA